MQELEKKSIQCFDYKKKRLPIYFNGYLNSYTRSASRGGNNVNEVISTFVVFFFAQYLGQGRHQFKQVIRVLSPVE